MDILSIALCIYPKLKYWTVRMCLYIHVDAYLHTCKSTYIQAYSITHEYINASRNVLTSIHIHTHPYTYSRRLLLIIVIYYFYDYFFCILFSRLIYLCIYFHPYRTAGDIPYSPYRKIPSAVPSSHPTTASSSTNSKGLSSYLTGNYSEIYRVY